MAESNGKCGFICGSFCISIIIVYIISAIVFPSVEEIDGVLYWTRDFSYLFSLLLVIFMLSSYKIYKIIGLKDGIKPICRNRYKRLNETIGKRKKRRDIMILSAKTNL